MTYNVLMGTLNRTQTVIRAGLPQKCTTSYYSTNYRTVYRVKVIGLGLARRRGHSGLTQRTSAVYAI